MSEKLKALMAQRGVSQTELARVAGVSEAFVSYVIRGYKMPSVDVLKRIADFLEVTIDWLIA